MASNSQITFVTAYLDIYNDNPPLERTNEWRTRHFKHLAQSGIQLCIYVSPTIYETILEYSTMYPTIKIMRTVNIEDTWVAKTCSTFDGTYTLPESRYMPKDTENYMFMQHSKTEFVQDAIEKNPWNSTHFAWIDFSIAYMFKNLEKSRRQLKCLSDTKFVPTMFAFPGCWGRWDVNRHTHHMDNVHWRFCGCFFIGDKHSVHRFCQLTQQHFLQFLHLTGKLMWEVNYWAWLEHITKDIDTTNEIGSWKPSWYDADHNDRCILVPIEFSNSSSVETLEVQRVNYPTIDYFEPTSASILELNGKIWLNTRFVNYYLTPHCYYQYPDGSGIIKNKNILSELRLDQEGQHVLLPVDFREMDEKTVDFDFEALPNTFSQGLEDIRLYSFQGRGRFIATTVNYSKVGRGRIVIGDYNVETATYSNCKLVVPPNPDSWVEKNWVPVVRKTGKTEDLGEEEWFIYKWSPMELGKLKTDADGNLHLEIIERYEIADPWFDRFRGSTTFLNTEEGLYGLTHFSIEGSPRHYYHALVVLDPVTLRPLKRSEPFYFFNIGVEFCIGMHIMDDGDYLFYVSRLDRDTTLVKIERSKIQLFDV